jgi:chromosomal replication initiation ATPase DnaA
MSVRHIIEDLDRRDALDLANAVARKHCVTLDDLLGRSRRGCAARARHELWARLYDEAIPTFSALARVFCRDHSTVSHAVRRHIARQAPVDARAVAPLNVPGDRKVDPCLATI